MLNMNTKIIFFPTKSKLANSYLNNIYNTIKNQYEITGFDEIKKKDYFKYNIYHFNWIESTSWSIIEQKFDYIKKIFFINILKLLKKKIIWTVHNNMPHETNNKKNVINFMKFMAKKSDRIHILCTETLENDFLKSYNNKAILIPHWDYVNNYPKSNTNIYEKYNIQKGKKIILFIWQVRKYKNIELLIKAFRKSKLEENDFILLICWKLDNQDYGEELKNLSNENVFFDFNFIKDSEIESYLRTSQIIIAPYDKSSSLNSWTLWMAMSYKKTMILPLIWCVKDIKDYDKFLYVYDYYKEDHYEKLLECLLKLKSDLWKQKNELKLKWEQAYNYLMNNQSWESQKQNRINLYKF